MNGQEKAHRIYLSIGTGTYLLLLSNLLRDLGTSTRHGKFLKNKSEVYFGYLLQSKEGRLAALSTPLWYRYSSYRSSGLQQKIVFKGKVS